MSNHFKIIKQEWDPSTMDCEHKLCDPLHKPWWDEDGCCLKPRALRIEWIIVDAETEERPYRYPFPAFLSEAYATKREAQLALDRYIG